MGLQTTLIWDVINDKSFANKLSKWVNMPQEKFARYGDVPKSKHLSSIQVKNLIQVGSAGPHTVWMNWNAKNNPPKPGNTRVEKGRLFGFNKYIDWDKAPSGDVTPGNIGNVYGGLAWPKEIANLRDAAKETDSDADEIVDTSTVTQPKPEMQKMSDVDWNRYTWKNWGKIDVAQQMSNWSNDPGQKKDALKREIRELLKIFGNKEYITGTHQINGNNEIPSPIK